MSGPHRLRLGFLGPACPETGGAGEKGSGALGGLMPSGLCKARAERFKVARLQLNGLLCLLRRWCEQTL